MFSATKFTYDGVSSDQYRLMIASFDSDTVETTSVFAPTLSTVKSSKSHKFSYAGVAYDTPPTASFTIVSESVISPNDRPAILRWLVGRKGFKELTIEQDDLENYIYRCIFTLVDMVYVNGALHGFTLTATFDSPYAYYYKTRVLTGSGTAITTKIELNTALIEDYTYPIIKFKPAASNATLTMYNSSDDSSRIFAFNSLAANTEYTVDNERRTLSGGITLSTNFKDLNGGNKRKWFRLVAGTNTITYTFNGTITLEIPVYKAIGF